MTREAEKTVQGWLDEIAYSAATWDLKAHMKLVSHRVQVSGLPSGQTIDYRGWRQRRHNEFRKKLLRSLTYRLGKILSSEPDRIIFRVEETMRPDQGQLIVIDKEVTLEREEDGHWRVTRERFRQIRQA
ncbi:MAG: hypothetical protein ACQETD_07705 [Pseudomonadota bacterium]